jgi:hypothetical protein
METLGDHVVRDHPSFIGRMAWMLPACARSSAGFLADGHDRLSSPATTDGLRLLPALDVDEDVGRAESMPIFK